MTTDKKGAISATFVAEPPRRYVRRFDWGTVLPVLRNNKGSWAMLTPEGEPNTKTTAYSFARNLRYGAIAGTTRGEFETTIRGTDVYARYVGLPEEAEENSV